MEVPDGSTPQPFARNGATMRVNRTGLVQLHGTGHTSHRFMGCKLLEDLRLQSQALELQTQAAGAVL